MKTIDEKYKNDPHFHSLVNLLMYNLETYHFTPSELREAVIFACTHFEMNRTQPVFPRS